MTDAAQPVAVPTATPQAAPQAVPQAVTNTLPPEQVQQLPGQDALSGFHKIEAARRTRAELPPESIPFNGGHIRIYAAMPAGFAFDGAMAEAEPSKAKSALRSAVWPEDREIFDAAFVDGIDMGYVMALLMELAQWYSARPLAD